MQHYSYSTRVAVLVGDADSATIIQNLAWWQMARQKEGTKFYDGRFWVYYTYQAIHELMPWLSERQVRRKIQKLEDEGFISSGCYSQDRFNRTKYYTVSHPEIMSIYGLTCEEPTESPESTDASADSGTIDTPESAIRLDETGASSSAENGASSLDYINTMVNTPYSPPRGDGVGVDQIQNNFVDTGGEKICMVPGWPIDDERIYTLWRQIKDLWKEAGGSIRQDTVEKRMLVQLLPEHWPEQGIFDFLETIWIGAERLAGYKREVKPDYPAGSFKNWIEQHKYTQKFGDYEG